MTEKPSQYFRAGAGAVIVDERGRVLALERAESPGSWQLPQGGLDENEEPAAAAVREAGEETGIPPSSLELVSRCPDLLAYELPREKRRDKLGRGQVHYWYLFRFKGDEAEIRPMRGEEFRAWKWCTMESLIGEVVEFRKPVYRRLHQVFSEHLD